MGQTSNQPQRDATPVNQPLTFVCARDNHVIMRRGDELLCQKQHGYPSETDLVKAMKKFEASRNLSHKHLQNLMAVVPYQINTFCSSMFRLKVFYEYCQQNMEAEIEARRSENNRMFEQRQLWSILCSCTLAFSYLAQKGIFYDSLTLRDIWLTEQGIVKLSHPMNAFYLDSFVFNQQCFYAPQQLDSALICKIPRKNVGVYQLGLALLRCSNLQDTRSFYKDGQLNSTIIGDMLLKASSKLDQCFINTLLAMLRIKPEERPVWNELENVIIRSVTEVSARNSIQQPIESPVVQHTGQLFLLNLAPEQSIEQVSQLPVESHLDCQTTDEAYQRQSITMAVYGNQSVALHASQSSSVRQSKHTQKHVLRESNRNINKSVANEKSLNQSTGKKIQTPNSLSLSITQQNGRYEGQTQDGLRHGYGTFYYLEGGIYTGQWVKGQMHGHGSIYYPSGKLAYEGQWNHDKLHGHGTLYNEQVVKLSHRYDCSDFSILGDYWVKYEGSFRNDNKCGQGKLILSNGQHFIGEFVDDEVNGPGTFYRTDGTTVQGTWKANIKQ